MIVSSICGGLGNQMFQYALGRALSLRHEVPLMLDLSWFASMEGCTPRRFHLDVFPALQRERGMWREAKRAEVEALLQPPLWRRMAAKVLHHPHWSGARYIREQPGVLTPESSFTPPVCVSGYWQDERYFLSAAATIRRDFSFPLLPSSPSAKLAASIEAMCDPTAVHIRRGDYVADSTTNAVHGTCSAEYYAAALKYIQKKVSKAHVFVFSDDPAWVRENFDTRGLPATVVDLHGEAEAHHDMHLMSLCKHHVIANSSFSWWAAWLAQPGGMTIAPKQWFANPTMADRDPCPERWMRI